MKLIKTIANKEIRFDVPRYFGGAGQKKVHAIASSEHTFVLSNLRRREVINLMMEVKLTLMESHP